MQIDEQERLKRRETRIAACGSWAYRLNPATGSFFSYQMDCGVWRECHACFSKRVRKFAERLERIKFVVKHPVVLQVTKTEARAIVRKLDKADYWRCPVEEGIILIVNSEEYFSDLALDDIDLSHLANTPKGTRYSGNLGRIPDDEKDPDSIVVEVPQYIIELPEDVTFQEVIEEAMALTKHLDPAFDARELTNACIDRMDAFRDTALDWDGKILYSTMVRIRVSLSEYTSWSIQTKSQEQEPEDESGVGFAPPGSPIYAEIDARIAARAAELGY